MKKILKTKTAGAGAPQSSDVQQDVLRSREDGPIAFNQQPEATPPDVIVEN